MKRPDWQLSRNGLFWVLFAFGAVIALHRALVSGAAAEPVPRAA